MDKKVQIKRLIIYLVFAFGLAWAFEFIFIGNGFVWDMSDPECFKLISLVSLGMLTPAIAHVIARALTKESFRPAGKDSMMLGIDLTDGKWKLFLFAILIPVIYATASDALQCIVIPGSFDATALSKAGLPDSMALLFPVNAIINGVIISFAAFGEEFGWRAYMMPKLNKLMGRYKALIVGGIIWGLWHAPLTCVGHNFGTDYPGFPYVGIIVMCIYCILLGTILTFVTERSGSVWPAAFLHGVNNAGPSFLAGFMTSPAGSENKMVAAFACIMLPLLLIAGLCIFQTRKGETARG